jgi:hypothetical protein
MALSIIGAGSISNLQTETSKQAIQCRLFYERCRNTVLSSANWGFAHKLTALALLTDTVFNWAYVYSYPSDCLYINRVVPNITLIDPETAAANFSPTASRWNDPLRSTMALPKVPFEVMNVNNNKVIVCNEYGARIDYRAKIDDANKYTDNFQMALAHLLVTHIARTLSGETAGARHVESSMQQYLYFKVMGEKETVSEQHTEQADSEFITIRG